MLSAWLTALGLIIAIVGVYYAKKQTSPPRRILRVDVSSPAPLLASESAADIGIEVTRDGVALSEPTLITITLDCVGDYDIARTAFDSGQPVVLEIGVPIIELLQKNEIEAFVDGTQLSLGPDLLKAGSRSSLLLLVDGSPNLDTVYPALARALVDVKVEVASQYAVSRRRGLAGLTAIVVGVAFIGMGLLARAFINDVQGSSAKVEPDNATPGSTVRLIGKNYASFEVVEFSASYTSNSGEDIELTIPTAQADADGHWDVNLVVPRDAGIGEVSISAEGAKYSADFIEFDVTQ